PTSQKRVGIGVPSSSRGALRSTTGSPDASRTTTSYLPNGGRPSNSVTRRASTVTTIRGLRPPTPSPSDHRPCHHRPPPTRQPWRLLPLAQDQQQQQHRGDDWAEPLDQRRPRQFGH